MGLAGNLVKDQNCPRDQQVQTRGEVPSLRFQHLEYLLVELEHVLFVEKSLDLA